MSGARDSGHAGRSWADRLGARLGHTGGPGTGRVSGLAVAPGLVTALVEDGAPRPWTVRVELPVLSDDEWRRAARALVADSDAREELLDGELPPDADAVFARAGLPLLPVGAGEAHMVCDCPGGPLPCGHLTAVLTALGAAFDAEPFLLTTWRGRDRRAVLDAVRNGPSAAQAQDPAGDSDGTPEDFWGGGDLPDRRMAGPAPAVAELGRPAVSVRGRTLSETLAPAYEAFLTW
ncbi:hypothetical protein [Actinacidiphila alni]|uniref:SWIM zinc finger family protein n=1 Tax=Actinacidiphila alni TaxID=380248 RepID=UPI0034533091